MKEIISIDHIRRNKKAAIIIGTAAATGTLAAGFLFGKFDSNEGPIWYPGVSTPGSTDTRQPGQAGGNNLTPAKPSKPAKLACSLESIKGINENALVVQPKVEVKEGQPAKGAVRILAYVLQKEQETPVLGPALNITSTSAVSVPEMKLDFNNLDFADLKAHPLEAATTSAPVFAADFSNVPKDKWPKSADDIPELKQLQTIKGLVPVDCGNAADLYEAQQLRNK